MTDTPRTQAELLALIDANIHDNTLNEDTPAMVRQVLRDFVTSVYLNPILQNLFIIDAKFHMGVDYESPEIAYIRLNTGSVLEYDRVNNRFMVEVDSVYSAWFSTAGVQMDHILELTAGHGVNIDSVLLKDGCLDLPAVASDPAYVDGHAIVYFYSSGGVDELRVRGKIGATETQSTIANLSP